MMVKIIQRSILSSPRSNNRDFTGQLPVMRILLSHIAFYKVKTAIIFFGYLQ